MASKWAGKASIMVTNILALFAASNITAPSTWYKDWGALVIAQGSHHGLTPEQSCAAFAALSPRKNIARNWAMFCQALVTGPASVLEATGRTRATVAAILGASDPLALLKGPKTNAFARNLLGDYGPCTVDSITIQALLNDRSLEVVPPPLYREASTAINILAGMLGWTNADVQAAIWIAWRDAKPKGRMIDPNPIHLLPIAV